MPLELTGLTGVPAVADTDRKRPLPSRDSSESESWKKKRKKKRSSFDCGLCALIMCYEQWTFALALSGSLKGSYMYAVL